MIDYNVRGARVLIGTADELDVAGGRNALASAIRDRSLAIAILENTARGWGGQGKETAISIINKEKGKIAEEERGMDAYGIRMPHDGNVVPIRGGKRPA